MERDELDRMPSEDEIVAWVLGVLLLTAVPVMLSLRITRGHS